MQIVSIADTHNGHNHPLISFWFSEIEDKENSLLIHGGDMTRQGSLSEIKSFLHWFNELPFAFKVLIPGNHDFWLESASQKEVEDLFAKYPTITYLNDSSVIYNDLVIYGSPIQPTFHNWAFNRERGSDIKKHWDMIPDNVDILVTHGPAYMKGDQVSFGNQHVGCEDLLKKIEEVKPKLHICGHIHEGAGMYQNEHTVFINASVVNQQYYLRNKPVIFNYEK